MDKKVKDELKIWGKEEKDWHNATAEQREDILDLLDANEAVIHIYNFLEKLKKASNSNNSDNINSAINEANLSALEVELLGKIQPIIGHNLDEEMSAL